MLSKISRSKVEPPKGNTGFTQQNERRQNATSRDVLNLLNERNERKAEGKETPDLAMDIADEARLPNGDDDPDFAQKVTALLDQLTPHNLDAVVDQFKALNFDDDDKLQICLDLVFEKAMVGAPESAEVCARLCKALKHKGINSFKCHLCSYGTGYRYHFKRHLKTVHKIEKVESLSESHSSFEESSFNEAY